jgi:hypothetical protein
LDLNFDRVDCIDERDFFETPLEKFEVEIIQVTATENHEGFSSGQGANRFSNKATAGVQMLFPCGPTAARTMANANLSSEKAVRACGPRTRGRDPFQKFEDHFEPDEEELTTKVTKPNEKREVFGSSDEPSYLQTTALLA